MGGVEGHPTSSASSFALDSASVGRASLSARRVISFAGAAGTSGGPVAGKRAGPPSSSSSSALPRPPLSLPEPVLPAHTGDIAQAAPANIVISGAPRGGGGGGGGSTHVPYGRGRAATGTGVSGDTATFANGAEGAPLPPTDERLEDHAIIVAADSRGVIRVYENCGLKERV